MSSNWPSDEAVREARGMTVPQVQSTPAALVPPRRYEIAFEVEGEHELRQVLDFVLAQGSSLNLVQLQLDRPVRPSIPRYHSGLDRERSIAERPRSRGRLAERVEGLGHREWAKEAAKPVELLQMFSQNRLVQVLRQLEDYLDSLDSTQKGE